MLPCTRRQQGLTIVELMVAMSISLVIVVAAAYVYLATRESQRAIDRTSSSRETGAFVMQMLGREIMNAGFYPAASVSIPPDPAQKGMYDTYPPLPSDPRVDTDWQNPAIGWPPAAFQSGIYGCDGGVFDVATSTCPATVNADADTLVINYFTSDTKNMGTSTGRRLDCTGSDVAPETAGGGDPHNDERKKNSNGTPPTPTPTQTDENIPPQLPVFVSNRFTLKATNIAVDQQEIKTKSLVCSGNGKSPHGKPADAETYQAIIEGLEDLQLTYGVYDSETTVTPSRFYTATEVSALGTLTLNGVAVPPWLRVTAVRVCLLTRTLGGSTRIADKAGALRKYRDCSDTAKDQPSGDTITRHIEVFGLRNSMKQYY
ncbi:prepilin-type N-terminal cleavage/methylation domain-containing protein [Verminephrobacter aporrectodeae subsp. tuberculatae]|uniref:PilW family protein n=1 Tax=Verminephrobacter aporrectodeae TaxID=1110389 RepID=UPI002238AA5D|nr:PilW family protein [Verminephrobacter aporrectodeae]MCW5220231.1 prepilin-type N-terminal cleavage/methylation domain-containing protein [Verminephrobacter aporrectodeae subsp. tuberculatae]MCW5289524.1 prepilin-type N-terminal cleavage/methylation domain-containing protein [Verminephrobacter aporrectodeae subsp. tuberculatae]MCW8199095.1 prepilin-type N-terminal cleavage/methylation domain-containing protein [Verminephrobacter aporrectodeae subsp. tuberculatae]